jgi:hypothetical protein
MPSPIKELILVARKRRLALGELVFGDSWWGFGGRLVPYVFCCENSFLIQVPFVMNHNLCGQLMESLRGEE